MRHCLPDKSKNALREISILGLRGDAPIKEASVTIDDTELKLAVVNGLANAKKLLKEIDEGKKFYHLIEVMTCQGGCVGGAGQPYGLRARKNAATACTFPTTRQCSSARSETPWSPR